MKPNTPLACCPECELRSRYGTVLCRCGYHFKVLLPISDEYVGEVPKEMLFNLINGLNTPPEESEPSSL